MTITSVEPSFQGNQWFARIIGVSNSTSSQVIEFSIFDKEGSLAIDLGVYGAPETFLINADGIIKTRYVGALTPEVWDKKFVIHLK